MDKKLFFYELEGRGYTFQNKKWDETKHGFEDDMLNMAWEMWSSAQHGAKAQAVPEGFVLVSKKPDKDTIIEMAAVCLMPRRKIDDIEYLSISEAKEVYQAMIKAQEQK